jgi:hypothetical protein
LVETAPGKSAIHRSPDAEIVGHDQQVRVGGRDGQVVLAGADHRRVTERGEVGPGASGVVRTEEVSAERIFPPGNLRVQIDFRSLRPIRRRRRSRGGGPGLEVRGFKYAAAGGEREQACAVG